MKLLCLLLSAIALFSSTNNSLSLEEQNKMLLKEIFYLEKVNRLCMGETKPNCISAMIDHKIVKLERVCNLSLSKDQDDSICYSEYDDLSELVETLKESQRIDTAIDKVINARERLKNTKLGAMDGPNFDVKICEMYLSKGEIYYSKAATHCCRGGSPLCRAEN